MSNVEAPGMTDHKGRPKVDTMTDRELAEETVKLLRSTQDTVQAFIESMASNPMLGMLMKRMGG